MPQQQARELAWRTGPRPQVQDHQRNQQYQAGERPGGTERHRLPHHVLTASRLATPKYRCSRPGASCDGELNVGASTGRLRPAPPTPPAPELACTPRAYPPPPLARLEIAPCEPARPAREPAR